MEPSVWKKTRVPICFGFVAAFLVFCAALLTQPFLGADGALITATYSHGILHLTIPYHADHRGTGQLTVEVLDPEDQALGKIEKSLEVMEGSAAWKEQIRLDKPLPLDELVWNRVRYRFRYQDTQFADLQGTESISQLLRMPVLHILGQQSYLEGSRAAVRVVVTDSRNEAITGSSSVRVELLSSDEKARLLFTGRLDGRGTTEVQFQFPAGFVGNYQLRYVADTSIGSTEFTQAVRLEDEVSILLTTEKPIYQPGQTIHIRALALDRSNHEAVANRSLTFELEDSRGNKVFKQSTQTSKFGIASAEFTLADEVNLGTYHLRAITDLTEGSAHTAELALNVEKYVVPKFKVAIDFMDKDQKARHGYRPGE